MSEITYSVIIPSVRPVQALNTVSALNSQTLPRKKYEIILVTPSLSAELTSLDRVKVVATGETFSPGKNRNIGARTALGGILLFIDDDCVPPQNWIESMVKVLEAKQDVAEVGCRVRYPNESFWGRCADYCLFGAYQYKESGYQDLGSAAIAVRTDAWRTVGGMDEELLSSEDWDLSLRLRQNGVKCYFNSDVTVMHDHGRTSLFAIIANAFRSGLRSGLIVQARHYNQMSWLAKLSLVMGKPFLYWLLILPYAVLVTVAYSKHFIFSDWRYLFYAPFVLMCQAFYHVGVFWRLAGMRSF